MNFCNDRKVLVTSTCLGKPYKNNKFWGKVSFAKDTQNRSILLKAGIGFLGKSKRMIKPQSVKRRKGQTRRGTSCWLVQCCKESKQGGGKVLMSENCLKERRKDLKYLDNICNGFGSLFSIC